MVSTRSCDGPGSSTSSILAFFRGLRDSPSPWPIDRPHSRFISLGGELGKRGLEACWVLSPGKGEVFHDGEGRKKLDMFGGEPPWLLAGKVDDLACLGDRVVNKVGGPCRRPCPQENGASCSKAS